MKTKNGGYPYVENFVDRREYVRNILIGLISRKADFKVDKSGKFSQKFDSERARKIEKAVNIHLSPPEQISIIVP